VNVKYTHCSAKPARNLLTSKKGGVAFFEPWRKGCMLNVEGGDTRGMCDLGEMVELSADEVSPALPWAVGGFSLSKPVGLCC